MLIKIHEGLSNEIYYHIPTTTNNCSMTSLYTMSDVTRVAIGRAFYDIKH